MRGIRCVADLSHGDSGMASRSEGGGACGDGGHWVPHLQRREFITPDGSSSRSPSWSVLRLSLDAGTCHHPPTPSIPSSSILSY